MGQVAGVAILPRLVVDKDYRVNGNVVSSWGLRSLKNSSKLSSELNM